MFTLSGSAKVTSPVTPLDFSGPTMETMSVTSAGCSSVTGNVVPSFNDRVSKASGGAVVFSGTAVWTGTKAQAGAQRRRQPG